MRGGGEGAVFLAMQVPEKSRPEAAVPDSKVLYKKNQPATLCALYEQIFERTRFSLKVN